MPVENEEILQCYRCNSGFVHGDGVATIRTVGPNGGDKTIHRNCVQKGDYMIGLGQLKAKRSSPPTLAERLHAEREAAIMRKVERGLSKLKGAGKQNLQRAAQLQKERNRKANKRRRAQQ